MLMQKELNLTNPSLPALSYLLRHRKLWPKDFVWGFSSYFTCAVGLTYAKWFKDQDIESAIYYLRFVSNCRDYFNIFIGGDVMIQGEDHIKSAYGCDIDLITPEMVADKIDASLVQ